MGRPARHGRRNVIAPALGDHDVEVGGLRDDREVAPEARPDRGQRPWPPSSSDGTNATTKLAVEAVEVAGRAGVRTAARMAAMPPFMSQAPRPYRAPSRISPAHGSTVQVAGSPGGTTSRWPDRTILRPPTTPPRR